MGDISDSILDSHDPLDFDGQGDGSSDRPISYKMCRRCGIGNLVWVGKVKGKWRLGDPVTMKVHECGKKG